MRVIMTTRRPGDRDDRESAALRPRPKVERPLLPLVPRKFLPVCPLLRGAHYLADEGQWALGTFVAVLNAPWPDAQVIVARSHRGAPAAQQGRWRSKH
jgi:hypothetical protein